MAVPLPTLIIILRVIHGQKLQGLHHFNIANANVVTTQVSNLTEGVYQFELKVIDAGGLFSKDTVQVTVSAASSNNL